MESWRFVWKLDRLGRNTLHILETVKALTDRGITLISTTDGLTHRLLLRDARAVLPVGGAAGRRPCRPVSMLAVHRGIRFRWSWLRLSGAGTVGGLAGSAFVLAGCGVAGETNGAEQAGLAVGHRNPP
jgi:hypothetical protein